MATTLVVSFDLGRYHATPWGRHVNEGQVELPPSPWRLLRALYAVWKTRAPELDEETVHALLGRLAEPPTYFVPPFTLGHTRHYYPDSTRRSGLSGSTDRTLDAFAAFDRRAQLGVRWPFDVDSDAEKTLARLAESLPYLGRADSLCTARLDPGWEPAPEHCVCGPVDVGESVSASVDAVSLLAPAMPLDVEALTLRPVDVRAGKLLFPRATRFVGYIAPTPTRAQPIARRRKAAAVDAVRFAVVGRARPPIGEALYLTDRLRGAAVKHLSEIRGHEQHRSLLAGRDSAGAVLRDHRHAHYLALPDEDGRVGDLVVWAPGVLADDELESLDRVRRLFGADGAPGPRTVQVRLTGYGTAADIVPDLVGPAKQWRSVTPYCSPRHTKGEWDQFMCADAVRELRHRALPEPMGARIVDDDWASFVRYRPSKRYASRSPDRRSAPRGIFIELTFAEPLAGPLALGHLSHYGLGLLRPASM